MDNGRCVVSVCDRFCDQCPNFRTILCFYNTTVLPPLYSAAITNTVEPLFYGHVISRSPTFQGHKSFFALLNVFIFKV